MKYQCLCKTPFEIIEKIILLRSDLINTGSTEGLLSPNTIAISQQLDACLNKYEVFKNLETSNRNQKTLSKQPIFKI
ncbi:aspartyl-phosphate phosphatase Spo0E family protein [Peribacillus deserti]|uniref:Aspartyl-phosphate phosphatase Spo0E family protein n=1 Tax=Peribacillus deserti TaxID=673318 RepID=A0A2N5M446_9BACI|nr:hypothetical protein CUU66_15505 [Peribacillus deserti]